MPLMNWNCRTLRKKIRQLARSQRLMSSRQKSGAPTAGAFPDPRSEVSTLPDNPNLKLECDEIRFCDGLKL